MTEIIRERMVVVWESEGPNAGDFRGAHIDELIKYDDGTARYQQRPLTESEADELIGQTNSQLISQLQQSLASTQSQLQAAQSQNLALQSHVQDLESQLDQVVQGIGNRRKISAQAWQARFTQRQELDLSISTDPEIIQGLVAVRQLMLANRLMSIDHPLTTATLNAMVRVGIITEEEKTNLQRDSTAEERRLA